MKRIIIFPVILILLFGFPITSYAKQPKHIKISTEQTCDECHDRQTEVWQDSQHGLMGVKCVVCHGDPNRNFMPKPAPERCVGCHADQVAGEAEHHKVKPKDCWKCHNGHALKLKSGK